MSTIVKSPDGLKNAKCKKGQLSNRPPIPYVPEVDIVTPKEEPQSLKVKLPDNSHLNMAIYSHGNTKEYLMHIVAVLHIIDQKGLGTKCRKLAKAAERQSGALKNIFKAAGSQDKSQQTLMFKPARWRLSRPNRFSKKPRRLTTRQLPRRMTN
jgi:hypothetical protein